MLNTEEVNKILIKYKKLIDDSILKTKVDFDLLFKRGITLDDLKQEVYIKLWERLENFYDSKYDIEKFISFHASFHSKFIMSNLRRSANCLEGTKNGKTKSSQARIDADKIYLHDGDGISVKFSKSVGGKDLIDYSYLILGESDDYNYIVSEIKRRLLNQEKSNKNYNQIYVDVFEFIIDNYNLLHSKNVLQAIIAEKFKYTTKEGVRYVLNKIKQIMYEVINDYGCQ